ncbi:MAG: glycosyltransferase family 2 protein [Clostridium sp.]|nr:glycosyltransferase family 2 protein [Clostridium sp.]
MQITVGTPTFNRAHLLPRLYKSLCNQSRKDFEWLIVDDGSQDETESVVGDFIAEGMINIRYFKKENGGKHTAVNLAAKEAKGELFFIADSDDWLPQNAIADVLNSFETVKDNDNIAGICGLDAYADGTLVGSSLPFDEIDSTPQDIRYRWDIVGDMKEVFRTSVIRRFPFPVIPGERFCPEALVWNRIGRKYRLHYINKPIYRVEYQSDGLTSSITRMRMLSPVATMLTYSEWFNDAPNLKLKIKMAINFWRFRFCSKKDKVMIAGWGNLLMPLGYILHIIDRMEENSRFDPLAFFGLNKGKS